MSYTPTHDPMLEIAKGNIPGHVGVNKFGRCPDNVDSGVDTDIWDGADAATGTVVWVAPTQARIHAIVSTSASDASAGVGANTVQVYGLADWDTKEVSETVTLNGTTPVNTVNSYVIIHRMKVTLNGSTNINVGVITATAATDSTVTAQINAGEGQTQMAIYGVPSVQDAYMTRVYAAVNRTTTASVDITVLANHIPGTELTQFATKSTFAANSSGTTYVEKKFLPPKKFPGPAILKIQGNSSANNTDVSAGFDLVLVDNA